MIWTLISVGALVLSGVAQQQGMEAVAAALLATGTAVFGKEYLRASGK